MPAENIFAQFAQPVRSVSDYLADYDAQDARKLQLEGSRRQNALAALTQQQTMRQMADADADRSALQAIAAGWNAQTKPEDRIAALRNSGRPGLMTQADALEKQWLDRQKTQSDVGKATSENAARDIETQAKAVAQWRDLIGMATSPEHAATLLESMHRDPRLAGTAIAQAGPQQGMAALQAMPFDQWKQQFALGAAKFIEMNKPQYITQNLGGTSRITAVPGLGVGPAAVTSESPITQSADNAATNARLAADAAASRQVTIRGQNLTDERAREANKNAPGKAPPGYRFTPEGNLEAIPGGPADRKNTDAGIREQRAKDAAVAQADRVIAKVDSALEKVGVLSAGPGSVLAKVPGTDARNLQSTLETIKANLGFAELQAMRDASPTGGALGAIAVQELTALQATVASLDQGQSPTQLRQSLKDISKHYSNWKKAVSGAAAPAQASAAQPREVKRTGTSNGRKVVEYTDGSIEYAD